MVEENPEEDPQGKGMSTLLIAAGAERGGGWGEWKGRGEWGCRSMRPMARSIGSSAWRREWADSEQPKHPRNVCG